MHLNNVGNYQLYTEYSIGEWKREIWPNMEIQENLSKAMMLRLGFKRWLRGKKKQNLSKGMGLPDASDGKESACNVGSWVWSLGWEDPLEKSMATHSSILAWRIPWEDEAGRLQSMGLQRVRYDWMTKHNNNLRE